MVTTVCNISSISEFFVCGNAENLLHSCYMYQLISKQALKDLIASKESFVLLDVRGEDEWKEGHIDGSVLMPHWFVAMKINDVVPTKETKIVTYCLSGGRSSVAAKILSDLGYSDVWNLEGGYSEYIK